MPGKIFTYIQFNPGLPWSDQRNGQTTLVVAEDAHPETGREQLRTRFSRQPSSPRRGIEWLTVRHDKEGTRVQYAAGSDDVITGRFIYPYDFDYYGLSQTTAFVSTGTATVREFLYRLDQTRPDDTPVAQNRNVDLMALQRAYQDGDLATRISGYKLVEMQVPGMRSADFNGLDLDQSDEVQGWVNRSRVKGLRARIDTGEIVCQVTVYEDGSIQLSRDLGQGPTLDLVSMIDEIVEGCSSLEPLPMLRRRRRVR